MRVKLVSLQLSLQTYKFKTKQQYITINNY